MAPNHYFLINYDKNQGDLQDFKNHVLERIKIDFQKNIVFLNGDKRVAVNHGGFSQVRCELNLLKFAGVFFSNIDYFHIVSGQDFPCMKNKDFDSFFEQAGEKSFMHYDSTEDFNLNKKLLYKRVNKYWFYDQIRGRNLYSRILKVGISELFSLFLPTRKEIENFSTGWQWMSLHKRVVEFILIYVEKHPEYVERFHNTRACDELFFHTMLRPYLKELNIISDNALRFIEWHPKRPAKSLPLVLDEREFQEIRDSGAIFCRKVSLQDSAKLLDLLEQYIKE